MVMLKGVARCLLLGGPNPTNLKLLHQKNLTALLIPRCWEGFQVSDCSRKCSILLIQSTFQPFIFYAVLLYSSRPSELGGTQWNDTERNG